MKSIYPQYDKNSDMSRGAKNSFARVRFGSQGDGGHLANHDTVEPVKPSESMKLKQVRRKG